MLSVLTQILFARIKDAYYVHYLTLFFRSENQCFYTVLFKEKTYSYLKRIRSLFFGFPILKNSAASYLRQRNRATLPTVSGSVTVRYKPIDDEGSCERGRDGMR